MVKTLTREGRWLLPFTLITGASYALAQYAGARNGVDASEVVIAYASKIFFVAPMVLIGATILFTASCALRGERSPIQALLRAGRGIGGATSVTSMAVVLLLTPVLMGAYGTLKMLMPLNRAFTWDQTFASMDRWLFLGWEPWQLSHALFGSAAMTVVIDQLYTFWVPLMLVAVPLAAAAPRVVRARFFLSFASAWLLIGVFGAYAFASAGPCYSAQLNIDGASAFAPLMERLHAVHNESMSLNAVNWQAMLWNAHTTQDYKFAMGISAMPSMHNAITMLYVLALWNARPLARYGSRVFMVVVLIGSVHLGWHYAVDGFAAWAAMLLIWIAVGRYLRWSGYIDRKLAAEDATGTQPSKDGSVPALAFAGSVEPR